MVVSDGSVVASSSSSSIPAREYNVSDVVFAKMKGYPPWPARVLEVKSKDGNNASNTKYIVLFYGTHQTGTCKGSDLCLFEEIKEEMRQKNQNKKGLLKAIEEAETNPDIDLPVQESEEEEESSLSEEDEEESSKESDSSNVTNGSRVKKRKMKSRERKPSAKRSRDSEMSSQDDQSGDDSVQSENRLAVANQAKSMSIYTEARQRFMEWDGEWDGLFDGVRPAVSRFLQLVLFHVELLPDVDYSEEEELISELGEKRLSSLMEQFEKAKLEGWTKNDVFTLLKVAINCPQSKRFGFLKNKVAERIEKEKSADFLQNIIGKEELDNMFPLGFELTKFHQGQLLLKSEICSEVVVPWAANESTFLRDFDLRPPSTYRRMLHFKHFQYITTFKDMFVKIFAKEVLCMMKDLQDSNLAPPFFKKIVRIALRMNDKNFTPKEKPLPLETQLGFRQIETEFHTLVLELSDLLKSSERNLLEGLLDKLLKLGRLEVTKVMLSKLPEAVNLVHHLTKLKFAEDQTCDLENVNSAAKTVMKKFEGLLIDEELEQIERRKALFTTLKVGNLALVRAAESRPHLFNTITQEPIAVNLTYEELVQLEEEMQGNFDHQMDYVRLWAANNGFFL